MLDETRARALQEMYIISKHPVILSHLRHEIECMSLPLFVSQLKKTGYRMDNERLDELAYESSTRFIEMYLKNPDWECRSFRNRIYLEVLFFLYSPKAKQQPHEELDETVHTPEPEYEEDTRFVIEDIMSDTTYWRNVLMDCWRSKTYRSFILTINQYVDKKWIYDHAIRLHKLYVYTRKS